MSRSMLIKRLRELEHNGVIVATPKSNGRGSTYALTDAGRDLTGVVEDLAAWAERWVDVRTEHTDPGFALWVWCKVQLNRDALPDERVVVAFRFPDERAGNRRFWLLVERGDAEVCLTDPGGEPAAEVVARSGAFVDWHRGVLSWRKPSGPAPSPCTVDAPSCALCPPGTSASPTSTPSTPDRADDSDPPLHRPQPNESDGAVARIPRPNRSTAPLARAHILGVPRASSTPPGRSERGDRTTAWWASGGLRRTQGASRRSARGVNDGHSLDRVLLRLSQPNVGRATSPCSRRPIRGSRR